MDRDGLGTGGEANAGSGERGAWSVVGAGGGGVSVFLAFHVVFGLFCTAPCMGRQNVSVDRQSVSVRGKKVEGLAEGAEDRGQSGRAEDNYGLRGDVGEEACWINVAHQPPRANGAQHETKRSSRGWPACAC